MNPLTDVGAIRLPDAITTNIDQFTGRTWLLAPLLDWYDKSNERIFLLTGGPGSGKSMVMAWLAGEGPAPGNRLDAERLTKLRNAVSAIHFCQATSRNNSPLAFADAMAHQLTANVPSFSDALASTMAGRVQIHVSQRVDIASEGASITGVSIDRLDMGSLGDEQAFDLTLSRPLKALYASGHTQPTLLLVDALDEALTYSGVKLPRLLSQLDDLPAPVRILATTRPDRRVLKHFSDAPTIDLARPTVPHSNDIEAFVRRQLHEAYPDLAAKAKITLAGRISHASQGIFLYAHLVLDELRHHMPDDPGLAEYSLPDGLSQLYQAFLNRELGTDEERWYAEFEPILGLIAVARDAGFTATQLHEFTGLPVTQPLRLCNQYLVGDLPEGPFRPFHRSLSEFLLEDVENSDYHIDSATMHRRIVDHYVSHYEKNWTLCDVYGLSNIIDHAAAADLSASESRRLFSRILTNGFVTAVQNRMGWLYSLVEDLATLAESEPALAADLCYELILDRPANSLVIQHALRLLVHLGTESQTIDTGDRPLTAAVYRVVELLGGSISEAPAKLLDLLTETQEPRLRGLIALALAETGSDKVTATLVKMLRRETRGVSWSAADALIALNDRTVIPELVAWYQTIQHRNDPRTSAQKQRILYTLGWMHAQEAQELKENAWASSNYRVIGRGVDLCWLLQPVAGDRIYLQERLHDILDSSLQESKTLGPWADEWLQKRLVRAVHHLHMTDLLPELRQLRSHIRTRSLLQSSEKAEKAFLKTKPKRERLLASVDTAIMELEIDGTKGG